MKELALSEVTTEPVVEPSDWGFFWPFKFVEDTYCEHRDNRGFTITGSYEGDWLTYPGLRDHDWKIYGVLYERAKQIVEAALKPEGSSVGG